MHKFCFARGGILPNRHIYRFSGSNEVTMTTMPSYSVQFASTNSDLEGILKLQSLNLKDNVGQHERGKEGFVTLQHDLELLNYISGFMGQVVAVNEEKGEVVGYALAKPIAVRDRIPLLKDLVDRLSVVEYKGSPLEADEYYIIGQVCVAQECRGTGLLRRSMTSIRKRLLKSTSIALLLYRLPIRDP
jgi:hypothetical protein